ncbi:hypothetical protein ATKI12_3585 [Kitasatospora sp. Ki12]
MRPAPPGADTIEGVGGLPPVRLSLADRQIQAADKDGGS